MSRRRHRWLDYLLVITLVLTPFLFGFAELGVARAILILSGLVLFGYSAMTDYLFGIGKLLPFSLHRVFDVALGVLVGSLPHLLAYVDQLNWFQEGIHYLIGAAIVITGLFTRGRVTGEYQIKPSGRDKAA